MKKFVLLSVLLWVSVLTSMAKSDDPVYFYGVDYTSVKVYGASETVQQFSTAFVGINQLLVIEEKKYDFSKMAGKNYKLKIDRVLDLTENCDFDELMTNDREVDPVDVAEKLKEYDFEEECGKGLIVIATLLDKTANMGSYKVVLFDVATREILQEKAFSGKAKGFGLRNYWARTIYNLSKKVKFK